ncbi:hypothetical protein ECZU12_54730 [Escherichia coli]|nr:hypothetical protein ECZU12_54730 [Escherichia coli]
MMNLLLLMMILEGALTFPGDKRIEGSVWPKSIRGSTPKVRGTCQIERAASESPHFMRVFMLPARTEEQYLKFGDKETPFGSNGRRMTLQRVLSLRA